MEKWEEGYYITAMAGSMSGSSLVVMSKGTPYTQQSYKARGARGLKDGGEGRGGGWGCGPRQVRHCGCSQGAARRPLSERSPY